MSLAIPIIGREQPIADLLRFLTSYLGEPKPEYRIPPSAIPAFVPAPLRAIYEFVGKWPERHPEQWFDDEEGKRLFQVQDWLHNVEDLKLEGGRLIFATENQGCWRAETLPGQDDPPVWCRRETEAEQVADRLSHFLVTMCLQEIVYGSKHVLISDDGPESPNELVSITVEPVWLDGPYVYAHRRTDIYLCDKQLLLMRELGWWLGFEDASSQSCIAGPQHLRRIR
jgi:hypothetical protein